MAAIDSTKSFRIVVAIKTKDLKKFMQSKPEIYNFIVRTYQGYLPPYADCTPGKYAREG